LYTFVRRNSQICDIHEKCAEKEQIYVTFEKKRLKNSVSRIIDRMKYIKISNCGEFCQLFLSER